MADDKTSKQSASLAAKQGDSTVAPFAATGRGKPCPICGRPSIVEMRPFCSKRCADIDLGRWLNESYRVPTAEPAPDDDGESPESPKA